MARTRTLAELRAEVRQRADCENDPHITDAELTRYINQSGAALHGELVDLDEMYFFDSFQKPTVAGSESLVISKDNTGTDTAIYKLLHVSASVNGVQRQLERWTFEKRTLYANASLWGLPSYPIAYRYSRRIVAGSSGAFLYFAPAPDAAYMLTIDYVKAYIDLVGDTDAYDGGDGWEELIVIDAAIKCVTKEEGSLTDLQRERAVVLARVTKQMATPDLDHPAHVRDVDGDFSGWWP